MAKKRQHLSYNAHGVWVRHKTMHHLVGRIGYYDKVARKVWVVWEPATYTTESGVKIKQKTYSSSSYPTDQLLRLTGYEPEPWYKNRAAQ